MLCSYCPGLVFTGSYYRMLLHCPALYTLLSFCSVTHCYCYTLDKQMMMMMMIGLQVPDMFCTDFKTQSVPSMSVMYYWTVLIYKMSNISVTGQTGLRDLFESACWQLCRQGDNGASSLWPTIVAVCHILVAFISVYMYLKTVVLCTHPFNYQNLFIYLLSVPLL